MAPRLEVSDGTLARRLERAVAVGGADYARAFGARRPESGATFEPHCGGMLVFAGVESPLSHALGIGLNGPVTAAELDHIEAFYFGRGAPVHVDLCPRVDASLRRMVADRKYVITEFENAWVRPLAAGESFPDPSPGVDVRPIRPGEAEAFAQTIVRGFFEKKELTPADVDIVAPFTAMRGTTCYLATVDGEPAGGGCMALHDGLAALFTTSTLPARRKRGVQTSLLDSRLNAAVAAGCDLAFVYTSPGSASERNVERLGFRLAYTRPVVTRPLA